MHLHQFGDNQTLNLDLILALSLPLLRFRSRASRLHLTLSLLRRRRRLRLRLRLLAHIPRPLPLRKPDLILHAGDTLTPLGLGHADPPFSVRLGRHEDDLPLARGQQVPDDEVVRVPLQRGARLVDQQRRVGLELEGDDHAPVGGPAVDEAVEEFRDGVQVDDEFLAVGGRLGVVVARVYLGLCDCGGITRSGILGGGGSGGGGAATGRDFRGLDLMLRHAVPRDEEVADGGGEVEQGVRAQRSHDLREGAQLEEVLGYGGEG